MQSFLYTQYVQKSVLLEETHMGSMDKCPQTFGHRVYLNFVKDFYFVFDI